MSVVSSHYSTPSGPSSVFPSCDLSSAAAADVDQPIPYYHTAASRQQRVSSTASTEETIDECDGDVEGGVTSDRECAPLPPPHSNQQQQQRWQPAAPQLPPHRSPSQHPPAMTQSTPSGTRRLTYRESSAATPASQPVSPPPSLPRLQSDTAVAAAATQSAHLSASFHPDVPLAPAPSFSLHHRQHHLNKFLSSPLGSALLLNKLRSGAIFLKHGQRGLPHYRYVWVKEEEGGRDRLCWAELRRRDKARGGMDVKGLLRVEEGHTAGGVFGRSRGSDPRRCFSVVGEDRALDLECISEEDREMWVIAFAFLVEHSRRGGSLNGGVGVDVAGISPSLSLVSALELLCEQNHSMAQSKLSSSVGSSFQPADDERRELLSSTATTAASSCYSTPERPRSGEAEIDGHHISYTVSGSQQYQPAPLQQQQQVPYPHVSPTSQVRVSHVNRFEVIDIIDDGLPIPPPQHIAAALPLSTSALPSPAASDDPRLLRLHTDLELYKADNRRLLLSHAHKMMSLQREIDELMAVNTKLRQMKLKADRGKRSSAGRTAGQADSDGEMYQHSDESD